MATVKVKQDGKAPSGLKTGDSVVTGGGTYRITGVNSDGTYKSEKINNETTSTYKGSYDDPAGSGGGNTAPAGGGSTGGNSRNSSPTVSNAANAVRTANTVNTATGITNGYKPTGTYNDAGMRAMGNGTIDPITQYKLQYEAAKARGDQAGMDQAHNLAEQYRAQFGYSGGLDGSENIGVPATAVQALQQAQQQVPQWQMPDAYQFTPFEQTDLGKYALSEYQGLLDKLQSYKPFSYNPEEDPLYQQYADSYIRSGQRAASDILGQLAARTGGMASSYAGAMAQQGYDQYMQELAAKVPELRQIAYNMYADDYNRQLGLYDRGYQRFSDDFNRYMDQERFNYGLYDDRTKLGYQAFRDQVADQQWQNQFDWTKSTDARDYARNVLTGDRDYEANRADTQWNQNWQQTQFDYQKEQDAKNWELQQRQYQQSLISELLDRVERGYVPTKEDADRLGLTPTQLAQYQNWARERNRQENSKYYAFGGY